MRFVFVHGGFHAAWCWERTIAELATLGHDAVAVDLPGHGARAGQESTLSNRRQAILDVLTELAGFAAPPLCAAKLDVLIDNIRTEPDLTRRRAMIATVMRLVADEVDLRAPGVQSQTLLVGLRDRVRATYTRRGLAGRASSDLRAPIPNDLPTAAAIAARVAGEHLGIAPVELLVWQIDHALHRRVSRIDTLLIGHVVVARAWPLLVAGLVN